MVFFKLERTASKVLPEHVQKCLLAHCQLVMTDVSELQVWLLVDRVLGKEWTIKDSQMMSQNTFEQNDRRRYKPAFEFIQVKCMTVVYLTYTWYKIIEVLINHMALSPFFSSKNITTSSKVAGSCVKCCAPYPINVFCPNAKRSLTAGSLTTIWERRRKGADQGYNERDNQYIGYLEVFRCF